MAAIIPIRAQAATPSDELLGLLTESLQELQQAIVAFRQQPPTPARTYAFEKKRPRSRGPWAESWSNTNTTASSRSA